MVPLQSTDSLLGEVPDSELPDISDRVEISHNDAESSPKEDPEGYAVRVAETLRDHVERRLTLDYGPYLPKDRSIPELVEPNGAVDLRELHYRILNEEYSLSSGCNGPRKPDLDDLHPRLYCPLLAPG